MLYFVLFCKIGNYIGIQQISRDIFKHMRLKALFWIVIWYSGGGVVSPNKLLNLDMQFPFDLKKFIVNNL
jgi:hypothetical protein